MTQQKAVLVLEDGRIHTGTAFGAVGQTLGEAVFSTGMSGYQETLTDPSYHRQIVIATAPQIGNTGWNQQDGESRDDRIWVAGYVVRDPSPRPSNWRSTGTLEDELIRQGVVGIAGVDTRAIVRHLRTRGSMAAGVFSGPGLADDAEMLDRVRNQPAMLGADLCGEVSTSEAYIIDAVRTPVGKRNGALAGLHPIDLGVHAFRGIFGRNDVDPAAVDDAIVGCVDAIGGQAGNIGRLTLLAAGYPEEVPGVTVDRQCGSSQQAISFGAQAIIAGTAELILAGGMQNMSRIPISSAMIVGREFGFSTPTAESAFWAQRYRDEEISQFRGA